MLRAFKSLNAIDFAEKDADTGLGDPVANGARVTISAGGAAYTLELGKAQKGTNRYLQKPGADGTVFVVSSWAADWAVAEPAKFEKKDDKDAKDADKGGDDDDHDDGPPPFALPGMD